MMGMKRNIKLMMIIIGISYFLHGCATIVDKPANPFAELKQYGLFSPIVKPGVKTDTIFKHNINDINTLIYR